MSQDKALTEKKLSALWGNRTIKKIDTRGNKIVMFSDMHLGDGSKADDFRHNHKVFEKALEYYKRENYTVILLGDIEEFWQFDLDSIINTYDSTVYRKLRLFENGRFYRVYGNHDSEWGSPRDPARKIPRESGVASEALKLKGKDGRARILLIHGHQGSKESDKNSWISRVFVRLYKRIEPVIKIDRHTSATKSQIAKNYEKIMYSWAKKKKVILICGHSHRAIFASETYIDKLQEEIEKIQKEILDDRYNKKFVEKKIKELNKKLGEKRDEELKNRKITRLEKKGKPLPCYFNTGCALYTDGGTAIEIDKDEIRLVKWAKKNKNRFSRDIFKKGSLSDIIRKVV
ncbi:MAG: metallophosphoesterase family protein [Candidatus Zixiibacteriota bacterium]|nr:MAG: metallophosphoesterase family protein [candidate division Zixibacteria bacterium]